MFGRASLAALEPVLKGKKHGEQLVKRPGRSTPAVPELKWRYRKTWLGPPNIDHPPIATLRDNDLGRLPKVSTILNSYSSTFASLAAGEKGVCDLDQKVEEVGCSLGMRQWQSIQIVDHGADITPVVTVLQVGAGERKAVDINRTNQPDQPKVAIMSPRTSQ